MKKILVVDDEEDLCFYVKRTLERTGEFNVITSSHPEQTLHLCQSEKPDLILLDVVMPNLNGTEVIKSLQENPETKKILIVVTSGLGEMVYSKFDNKWKWESNRPVVQQRGEVIKEHSAERAAAAYGVADYLAKPFSPATLLTVVKEVLKRGEQEKDQEETSSGSADNGSK